MDPLTAWLFFAVVVLLIVLAFVPRRRMTKTEQLRQDYYLTLARMKRAASEYDINRTMDRWRRR